VVELHRLLRGDAAAVSSNACNSQHLVLVHQLVCSSSSVTVE
jgi:hypothetical protein